MRFELRRAGFAGTLYANGIALREQARDVRTPRGRMPRSSKAVHRSKNTRHFDRLRGGLAKAGKGIPGERFAA